MIQYLTLPTLDAVPAEMERARAAQVAEDISAQLRTPLQSIDARARSLEIHSPLFRDSGASGQFGLFSEVVPTPPARVRARSAGFTVRHFAQCGGETVTLLDFGMCPKCSAFHKTERRIKYSNNPSNHGCDARCMSALGPNCECHCGGKNHGCMGLLPSESNELFTESEE